MSVSAAWVSQRIHRIIVTATLLLVASTLVLAPLTRGNRSWLIYGPLSLQPAELAKIGLVLMMARYFHRHPPGEIRRLADLAIPGLIAAGPVALIVMQRDMGVAVLTLLIAATYLLFVRIPARAWIPWAWLHSAANRFVSASGPRTAGIQS